MRGHAEIGKPRAESRRPSGWTDYRINPHFAFCISLFLLLLPGPVAQAAQDSKPEIVEARIGLDGLYKLGCWTPIEITILGGSENESGHVEISLADTDGVMTSVSTSQDNPVQVDSGKTSLVRLFGRSGQSNSTLTARFIVNSNVRASRTFFVGDDTHFGDIPGGLPATNRLLMVFGPPLGLDDLIQNNLHENLLTKTKIAHLDDGAKLPTEWIGYEGFETVWLTTSRLDIYQLLQHGTGQLEALRQWVERGGRLIISCGKNGPDLLGEKGPLANLIPGRYDKQVPLYDAIALETLSGSETSLTSGRRRLDLRIPRLVDVRGKVLAYSGRQSTNLPLVIRAQHGLGEVTFVAVDLDRPPFKSWDGRPRLLQEILGWEDSTSENDRNTAPGRGGAGYDDLTGQLRNALDSHFQGVQTISFAMVAILAIAYIGLIGPGDFFFLRRILRRMELTWITFPLVVIGTTAGAYWLAHTMKGDQLRVDQVEIVDVDTSTGLTRGTVWTHFFSPRTEKYNLTLEPQLPGNPSTRSSLFAPSDSSITVSWLGLPGYALGGMQTNNRQTSLLENGYRFGDKLQSLDGMPVQIWSTKTINARWSTTVLPALDVELRKTSDELLDGHVTNNLGVELTDCLLLYGPWAYHLARLNDGTTIDINDDLEPRTVKTMLTSSSAGDETVTRFTEDGTVYFDKNGTDVARIVKSMMFYEAIGGNQYTNSLNRYQQFIDMSRTLKTGRAILLGRCQQHGSQWFDGDQPLKSEADKHWLFYRFVISIDE